jgi:hypothetical protein
LSVDWPVYCSAFEGKHEFLSRILRIWFFENWTVMRARCFTVYLVLQPFRW